MGPRKPRRIRLAALLCPLLAACGTLHDRPLPNGRGWGEDATLEPGTERLRWAATRAVRDPGTWIPALAAATIAVTGSDRRISEWAQEERPVFGDKDPGTLSDNLRDTTDVAMFTTALLTPSGPPEEVLENKSRGLAVEAFALAATITTTNTLKYAVHREQPSGGHESFVSNHATEPFAHAALIRRNIATLELDRGTERALNGAAYVMASGSAWARVEMGLHYPTDQLAGAAIGNFIALFIHDAFLGLEATDPAVGASPGPVPTLTLRWRW